MVSLPCRNKMAAMNEARVSRKTLSKSILDMKFMQKSKESALREAEAAEGIAAYGGDLLGGGARTVIEPSLAACESLMCARRSFHGANPEIERYFETLAAAKPVVVEEDVDVPAAEMAKVTHASVKLQPPKKKLRIASS